MKCMGSFASIVCEVASRFPSQSFVRPGLASSAGSGGGPLSDRSWVQPRPGVAALDCSDVGLPICEGLVLARLHQNPWLYLAL
eukprot:scaffold326035_cov15-Prasinocladus_malaysianus.AAC.1